MKLSVVRERALGIAFGQLLEKAAQEWNGHPAQRLAHPRELVRRRVELYRFGPALGYSLEVRKQAGRNFRHQITFAIAEQWLLYVVHRMRTAPGPRLRITRISN